MSSAPPGFFGELLPVFGSSHLRLPALPLVRLNKMGRNGKVPQGFVMDVKGPRGIKI